MVFRPALLAIAVSLLASVGCSAGVGAESPPLVETQIAASTATAVAVPTSTPWPKFGPPPVTGADISLTARVVPTMAPGDDPGSNGSSAPDPEPDMPGTPAATPTASPRTPLDNSGTFVPAFNYNYFVPPGWSVVTGVDEIVLVDPSSFTHVTLREHRADRSKVQSIRDLVLTDEPEQFTDWDNRSLSNSRPQSDLSHESTYAGTKHGQPYIAIVQWHLRGELLIEVVTEAPARAWAEDSALRNTAALAAASFAPTPDVALAVPVEVQNLLRVRFSQRPSGVFLPASGPVGRVELNCRQVFHDLLSEPVYVGSGVWQVFAIGDQGAQVWQIFEPSLSIVASAHNTSRC